MTVLTFPTNPTVGQLYDAPNEIQYVFDGVKWIVETVASTSAAVTDAVQDRVAPMFVNGPNTGITFAYNAATNVMNASITALNGNQLVNGVHEFTLESNGTLSLDGDPFVITSDSLVNSASSFSVSSDGTLTLTHPPESDPIFHPLSTVLTVQKAAGNYHTISGAYGLSLQATPVPSGYGLNTNTNFVDIFHDGISVNVNDNTWGFGTDGVLTLPEGSYITETAAPLGTAKSLDLHPGNPIYPTQYLRIYPTNGGDADHLHLTSGDLTATELFLGDDEQYVKLTNNGNVEIRTGALDYYNDTKGVWTFDSDGVLTLPTHNATAGSRIKSAVDITIETGPYYLVDLVTVGSGNGGGICVLDFLIYSAPDWATAVAVGDHVVSGTWTGIITAVEELSPSEDGRWRVTFAGEDFTGNDDKWSFYRPGAAGGTWKFGADGALRYPRNALQRDTATVECLGNTSTVVYTASGQYQHTIKLLIQVEGYVAPETINWDTQACEMMVAKSLITNNIASTVYGIVHTSVAPLATFTAQWNALTNRVEVLCATPSANSVYVRTFATEIYTAD